MTTMMNQADRAARRERVRARIAAENAGTEMQTLTVPAADVVAGDWLDEIGGSFGLVGDDRPRSYRALTIRDGGAAVVAVGDVDDGPGTWIQLDGRGYVVTGHAPCVVRRRVPVAV